MSWTIETEADWLAATHGEGMVHHPLTHQPRKRRLLACDTVRGLLPYVEGPLFLRAILVSEAYADGEDTQAEMTALRQKITVARKAFAKCVRHRCPEWHSFQAIDCLMRRKSATAFEAVSYARSFCYAFRRNRNVWPETGVDDQAYLRRIRDIFGNPFRPVAFVPEWQSDTAVSLARHIYEARDFAQMPILADALQDAGCDNADILNHCRNANATHVRGCWVVDLVLGKT